MLETKIPGTGFKIEESPEHDKAYIELFKGRFSSAIKARNLGDPTEYFPEENPEEEMNHKQLTKNEFITHLRETSRENANITEVINDIETSLEKAK
jgi:hypothetical protein